MPTEITLIGLGGYPDWSENSWGAHATLLILPCHGSYIRRYVATYKHNKMYVIVHSSLLFYSEFSKFNAYTRLVSWFQICDNYGILELRNVIQLFSWLSWIKNHNVFKKSNVTEQEEISISGCLTLSTSSTYFILLFGHSVFRSPLQMLL